MKITFACSSSSTFILLAGRLLFPCLTCDHTDRFVAGTNLQLRSSTQSRVLCKSRQPTKSTYANLHNNIINYFTSGNALDKYPPQSSSPSIRSFIEVVGCRHYYNTFSIINSTRHQFEDLSNNFIHRSSGRRFLENSPRRNIQISLFPLSTIS